MPFIVSAQEDPVERDAYFWGYYEFIFELDKKWSLDFKNQVRLNENATRFDYTAVDAGVSYDLTKWLDLNLTYRYNLKNHWSDGWQHSHQLRGNIQFSHGIGDFKFYNRSRFQTGVEDSFDLTAAADDLFYRNRTRVKYDIGSRWDIYAYFEAYFRMGPPEPDEGSIYRTRVSAGANFEVNSRESIRFFFVQDEQVRRSRPSQRYFFGFGYTRNIELH